MGTGEMHKKYLPPSQGRLLTSRIVVKTYYSVIVTGLAHFVVCVRGPAVLFSPLGQPRRRVVMETDGV